MDLSSDLTRLGKDCHPGRFLNWCWFPSGQRMSSKYPPNPHWPLNPHWTMKSSQSILRWGRNPSAYTWFPDNGLGLFTLDMRYPTLRASPGYLLAPANETAKPVSRVNPRRPGHGTLLVSSDGLFYQG